MKLITFLNFVCIYFHCIRASRVLMMLPIGSRSHKNIFTPLAENLVLRGHDVTIVSMYKEKGNKALPYTDVELTKTNEHVKSLVGDFNVFKMLKDVESRNINLKIMKIMVKNTPDFCRSFLNDPNLKSALKTKPDLILLPAFMNECGLILVKKFKVPFIYVTTSGLTPWTADLVGNPENPSYVPNQYLSYKDEMTLTQRIVNSIFRVVSPYLRKIYILNPLDSIAQAYLKDPSISLAEVEKDVSMVLVNSHHSLGYPRPLQPNVVEIGGIHCRKPNPILDLELNSFLNNSQKNSVILFSLGTYIKSSQMPESEINIFVKAFSRLPYNVIWKWDGVPIPNLPSNVLLKSWLPQQDVLAHPSIGGFFTHGGLLSTQEAIYHGVPMVGLPLLSDQYMNVKQAENAGIAVRLDLSSLTEAQIYKALKDIIENPKYRRTIQQRSRVMQDQETTPLERATYYTEYVIRHNGAKHLKSASASISSFSYYLIDVISILITVTVLSLAFMYYMISVMKCTIEKIIRKPVSNSLLHDGKK